MYVCLFVLCSVHACMYVAWKWVYTAFHTTQDSKRLNVDRCMFVCILPCIYLPTYLHASTSACLNLVWMRNEAVACIYDCIHMCYSCITCTIACRPVYINNTITIITEKITGFVKFFAVLSLLLFITISIISIIFILFFFYNYYLNSWCVVFFMSLF